MKKYMRLIAFFLVFVMILSVFPAGADDLTALGLNIPNIQGLQGGSKPQNDAEFSSIPMEAPINPDSYRLGPGDILGIHIMITESDLAIDYLLQIGADGKIFFPNVGEIYLSGIYLNQAKGEIAAKVKSVYPEKFNLYVNLSQPKKVKIYLTGMVKNPGPFTFYDNQRISEVIEQAGGFASGASNRYVYIKRKDEEGNSKLLKADIFNAYRGKDIKNDIRIQAGDIIEIPDAANQLISDLTTEAGSEKDKLLFEGKETFVYVYGEVGRSGRFEYIPGKKLSDYISYAGGPSTRALLSGVTLTRKENGQSKKYQINASDVLYNGDVKNDLEVHGGDVINVPGNFFYFGDIASFINTILLGLTLYTTATRK